MNRRTRLKAGQKNRGKEGVLSPKTRKRGAEKAELTLKNISYRRVTKGKNLCKYTLPLKRVKAKEERWVRAR